MNARYALCVSPITRRRRVGGLRRAGIAVTMAHASFFETVPRMSDSAADTATHDPARLDGLLRDVASGDRAAFESLYRSSSSRLMGVCMRVLNDRGEAEDVLQEVYVRIWHKAAQFDSGKASAITWLATIARNKAIDRMRARPSGVQFAPVELVDALPDDGVTPSQASEHADDRARLDACMDTLEPRRRTLIHAAFFDGSTYEELARRAGSPLGSVKSWIRRGLLQLRACLEP